MKQTRTAALSTIGAFALAVALFASPASATGNRDHHGDANRDGRTSYTEDNDTNDGGTPNNVADDGDDRHPSGRDRSVEHGGSGNQGRSESDPDDDGHGPDRSNGGPDKPNGNGGVDQADQDGNNGCGNDDDFEDDNEGWCGHKPENERGGQTEAAPVSVHDEKPESERDGRSADRCERDAEAAARGAHDERANDETDKPEADKPEADKPEADKPEADAAAAPERGGRADKPEADKPEADKPEADKPETDAAPASERDRRSADRCEHDAEAAARGAHDERANDETDKPEADDNDVNDNEAVADDVNVNDNDEADDNEAVADDADDNAAVTTGAPLTAGGEVLALEAEQTTLGAAGAELASSSPDAAVLSAGLVATDAAPASLTGDTTGGALASVAASSLAFTGDNIMVLLIVALLALALGWTLVRQSRRARPQL